MVVGALIGAATYTVTRIAVNYIQHRQEGFWNAIRRHGFDDWNNRNFALSTAIGALTSGVGSHAMGAVEAGTMSVAEATAVVIGTASFCANAAYQNAANQGEIERTPEDAMLHLDVVLSSATADLINPLLPLVNDVSYRHPMQ